VVARSQVTSFLCQMKKVKDVIHAAHRDEVRAQIKQAVSNGTMTQDKAD